MLLHWIPAFDKRPRWGLEEMDWLPGRLGQVVSSRCSIAPVVPLLRISNINRSRVKMASGRQDAVTQALTLYCKPVIRTFALRECRTIEYSGMPD